MDVIEAYQGGGGGRGGREGMNGVLLQTGVSKNCVAKGKGERGGKGVYESAGEGRGCKFGTGMRVGGCVTVKRGCLCEENDNICEKKGE